MDKKNALEGEQNMNEKIEERKVTEGRVEFFPHFHSIYMEDKEKNELIFAGVLIPAADAGVLIPETVAGELAFIHAASREELTRDFEKQCSFLVPMDLRVGADTESIRELLRSLIDSVDNTPHF